ncbi:MAG TPA: hypothetical protein VMI53_06610 [Opitutaceae bacterium]|nr:hypothetical protein [Opitutaceae bacterium]
MSSGYQITSASSSYTIDGNWTNSAIPSWATGVAYAPYDFIDTSTINHAFMVAVRIIRALRRNQKYAELYSNFSNGAISKRKFKSEASQYASRVREITESQLIFEYNLALGLCGESSLGIEDFSAMLDLDPIQVDEIIKAREQSACYAR